MKIIVASLNPVKIEVAKQAFSMIFPDEKIEVTGVKTDSGVPDQPFNDETFVGAQNRLMYIQKMYPEADYFVSQEGGIYEEDSRMFNRAWIMVCDKNGFIGKSSTASFYIPTKVSDYIRQGDELGTADDKFFGLENSKQKGGGVFMVTDGLIDRKSYYLQSMIIALCQIVHQDWYN